MNLYKLTTNGHFHKGVYVVASEPSAAEKMVIDVMEEHLIGYSKNRKILN